MGAAITSLAAYSVTAWVALHLANRALGTSRRRAARPGIATATSVRWSSVVTNASSVAFDKRVARLLEDATSP